MLARSVLLTLEECLCTICYTHLWHSCRNKRNLKSWLFRCFLQYDRLYVENEIYLYNEIEQRVERMIIGKKEVEVESRNVDIWNQPFLQMNGTPRGRTSRLKQRRTESRQEQNFPHLFNLFQKILVLLFLIIFIPWKVVYFAHLGRRRRSWGGEEVVGWAQGRRGGGQGSRCCWGSTYPTRSQSLHLVTLTSLQMKHRALWWRNAGGYSANGNNRGGNLNFPPGANLPQGLCWPVMGSFHSVKQNNWTMGEKTVFILPCCSWPEGR